MAYLDSVREMDLSSLEREVIIHNYHYWVRAQPRISDYDYDQLVELLRQQAPQSPVLEAVGTGGAIEDPAMRARIQDVVERYPVPSELEPGEKVQHDHPMLSLDKCYEEDTLRAWFGKFEGDAVVSPKVDGVAASLKYRNGRLVLAATRGDGKVGEMITANAARIVDLPTEIDAQSLEVRGEAYMPTDIFEREFSDRFANPRNLTAGALKQKDAEQSAAYKIHFFAYDVLGTEFETEVEKFNYLKKLGFSCVETRLVPHDQLQHAYDDLLARRQELGYETDGVVYRVNHVAEQQRMGHNAHHPRYAIAYKFQGDSGSSVLRDVEWSVSRTGSINPVGIVDPVSLSGATVTRVSLHNLAIMEKLGDADGVLRLGSQVVMMRRGGVIPHLESVSKHGDTPVLPPAACPDCGAPTRRDGDFLVADHTEHCRVFQIKTLEHFISVLKADGFGEKILTALFDAGLLRSPVDFFRLKPEDMLGLERMGEKLASKLVDNVQSKRTLPAEVFLRALAIDELGKHVSAILAREYGDMDRIRALTVEEFSQIHTIGEIIARKVVEGLAQSAALIDELLAEVTLTWPGPELAGDTGGKLAGKSFMFTGAMESMKRGPAQKLVTENGGKAASSVAATLDYLVLGDKDMPRYEEGWRSSKLKKAEQLIEKGAPLQIISESQFLEMVQADE